MAVRLSRRAPSPQRHGQLAEGRGKGGPGTYGYRTVRIPGDLQGWHGAHRRNIRHQDREQEPGDLARYHRAQAGRGGDCPAKRPAPGPGGPAGGGGRNGAGAPGPGAARPGVPESHRPESHSDPAPDPDAPEGGGKAAGPDGRGRGPGGPNRGDHPGRDGRVAAPDAGRLRAAVGAALVWRRVLR